MRKPTITAHSGCEGTADGSMEAVLRGIQLGADLVEVDVRYVPGLGLALSHDAAGDPAGLVTLEAVFTEMAGHPQVGVNCDVKEYGLAPQVLSLARACGLAEGQLAFSGSVTPQQLQEDPSILRGAGVYLNMEEALCELYREKNPAVPRDARPWDVVLGHVAGELEAWMRTLIQVCQGVGIRALNLPPRPFLQPYLRQLGEAGIRLSLWTVNEPEDMRTFLAMPWLENLTTRRVALALKERAVLEK